jgi:hypothetical protein
MPTYYAEDYDGKKNDDAVEPVTLSPVSDLDSKRVDAATVEDKAVKAPAKKTAKKK